VGNNGQITYIPAEDLTARPLMSPLWLKAVPWSTIISNAPLIVDGAKKLVSLVKSKPAAEAIADTIPGEPRSELASLRARIQRLEEEQRQGAELIRAMAESQAQMTQVVQALRARARLSFRVAVFSLVGVAVVVIWTLTR
jgi:hypothetical protein